MEKYNPTKLNSVKYTESIGKEFIKSINTDNKCQLCFYEKIGSIMMCTRCKSVVREEDTFSALNYCH